MSVLSLGGRVREGQCSRKSQDKVLKSVTCRATGLHESCPGGKAVFLISVSSLERLREGNWKGEGRMQPPKGGSVSSRLTAGRGQVR